MNQRERRLAAVVMGTIALWLGSRGLQSYQAAVDANLAVQAEAAVALADAQLEMARGRRARRDLGRWRRASLPTNRDLARSLYQDWLRTKLLSAGLQVQDLTDNSGVATEGDVVELSFVVRAQGNLKALVTFLHSFYQANHLQRISSATLATAEDPQQLDVQLTIDALILAGAGRSDQLPEAVAADDQTNLDELLATIVPRNLFASYQPPAKPEEAVAEAEKPSDDAANQARVTGFTYGGGGWRMSLREGEGASPSYYVQGDRLEVGQFAGRIAEIDRRRLVVETESGLQEIRLGQTLGEATPLDPPELSEAAESAPGNTTPQSEETDRVAQPQAKESSPVEATGVGGS